MDFSIFEKAAEEGSLLTLKDPAGKTLLQSDGENPITILLAGVNSPRWTKAADLLQNRLMNLKEKRDALEIRADRCGLLASITLAWDGIELNGEPVPCKFDDVKKFYMRFKWVADQVDGFITSNENFLPASSIDS
jgi:hypothetical protein